MKQYGGAMWCVCYNEVIMIIPNVKKIAILRANAIGDFLVTLPAIYAIREAYPSAELVLLGRPWHKQFLANERTPIDRVVVIPVTKGLREEAGMAEDKEEQERFFESMNQEQFDIAIHFQGKGWAANKFINKLGARVTAGIVDEGADKIDLSIGYYYYQSEVIRYLEVAGLIGARPAYLEPVIRVTEEDESEALQLIKDWTLDAYIVIHPCGTDIRRMWVIDKLAETADTLVNKGYKVVFTGTSEDQIYINSILNAMSFEAYDAAGKLSLSGLAAFFKRSRVVVAVDTGPLHLARYVGAKTVGLYWAPNIINWGPLLRDKHRPVICWKMECPQCSVIPNDPYPFEPSDSVCTHSYSFIQSIQVTDVVRQVESLLK
ncbi:MAG TPA: glycosyltransferase family 9 protein [Cytophagaceae bacterium]